MKRNVWVKLSLCFLLSTRKGYWGSRRITPRILDLGSRWKWVVSFTPGRFIPRERALGTHWIGGRVGPRHCGEEKNSESLPGLETAIVQPVSQPYTTELSWLLHECVSESKITHISSFGIIWSLVARFTLWSLSPWEITQVSFELEAEPVLIWRRSWGIPRKVSVRIAEYWTRDFWNNKQDRSFYGTRRFIAAISKTMILFSSEPLQSVSHPTNLFLYSS
jgi:hypothetical protein